MNKNHRANRSAVTATGPTPRDVVATLGVTLVALGPAIAMHWIATVLQ
jgi:hypothetical protein